MNNEVKAAKVVQQAEVDAIAHRVKEFLITMDEEQADYFSHLLDMIGGCIASKNQHAVLLIENDFDGTKSMAGINADDVQIAELVGFMAEAMRQQNTQKQGDLLN